MAAVYLDHRPGPAIIFCKKSAKPGGARANTEKGPANNNGSRFFDRPQPRF